MDVPPDGGGRSHAERLTNHDRVSTSLALRSDRRLRDLVDEASPVGTGIGGTAVRLEVEGAPVFVKRVPLTDLERRPENVMSTANLFQLPPFCQYGVGSTGFGVWRELAAHAVTTNWVLSRRCESFPLLYHWRVLAGPPAREPSAEEYEEMARMVAYWDGSPAVRDRLEAVARSSASVVLFLEHLPHHLHGWLTAQAARGGDALDRASAMVDRDLTAGVSFMNANGLLHFDAHFKNILTDGRRLYLADFGLATSPRFELSPAERDFLGRNLTHDRCHTVTQLVNWLVTALHGAADRDRFIRACAEGADPVGVPPSAAALITRYAPVAAVMNQFYRKLHLESRTTPYPVDEVHRVYAGTVTQPGAISS